MPEITKTSQTLISWACVIYQQRLQKVTARVSKRHCVLTLKMEYVKCVSVKTLTHRNSISLVSCLFDFLHEEGLHPEVVSATDKDGTNS